MQLEKMREAMMVIAEARDSERLRQFTAIGQDRMFPVLWMSSLFTDFDSSWRHHRAYTS